MTAANQGDPIGYATPAEVQALAAVSSSPCASLYLPLEAGFPQVKQNPVRYRQAVETVAERLRAAGVGASQLSGWLDRLEGVETDLRALTHPAKTLAVFAAPEALWGYALVSELPYQVAVGTSFAIRSLLRAVHLDRSYRVLALSVKRVALFEGDARGLRGLAAQEVPGSLEQALGSELVGGEIQFHSSAAHGGAPIYHGHSGSREERSVDLDRFHHVIAHALGEFWKNHGGPLVLAADQVHQGPFRAIARLRGLLADAVVGSPDRLSAEELHARAWPLVQKAILAEDRQRDASLERARKRVKAVDLLDDVAAAAVAGRVRRLWVEFGRPIPGRVDEAAGRVVDAAGDEDVLDELALAVLRRGGDVLVADSPRMPSATGAAAELR